VVPTSLPRGREFRARILSASALLSLGGVLLISLYLVALLRLSGEQWRAFAWIVAGLFPLLFGAQAWLHHGLWVPILTCLDARADGRVTPAELRAGFAAVANLPADMLVRGGGWWVVGGLLVAAGMRLRFADFPGLSGAIMVAGAASGGFVMMVFHFLLMKRMVERVRDTLASEAGRPEERARLVRRVPLAAKLMVSITGVTLFTVVFTVLVAQVRSLRPAERRAAQVQARFLDEWSAAVAADPGALAAASALAARLGIADALLRVEAGEQGGPAAGLSRDELRAIAAAPAAGDTAGFDSPHLAAWRALPDGGVLVAVAPRASISGEVDASRSLFALLLVVSTGVAVGLSWLLAGDVSRATEALRGEASRWSSGDLRRGRVWESEDELGVLWRSFEGMAESLRETVGRVAAAADGVEATVGEMVEVAASVSGVTVDQVRGIRQATASMEAIGGQVRGIAESSAALGVLVEESSSSVLELGAAGEELFGTAGVLSERVNEVSASIEQMVRSVREVRGSTEALSAAAEETSASMGEMAQSLREVDASAEQTARWSREVVESAESGQAKLVQAQSGMEAIRAATEAAERVVRTLGSRTREIGAIVDVIDEVADETNLLALNAAIIAAQAGEQGRAFSVVAEEIKDLADRVLASTKEIGSLIRSVQEEGAAAIGAIERGSRSVAVGAELWATAGSSWEAITQASRGSGARMGAIVVAVREQSRASGHVVELMDRVREGVEAIRRAAAEQDRGNEVISRSAVSMREVATQVRGTTEEQARGSGRIRESVEGVREAVERINEALQEQSAACRSAAEFLEAVWRRTQSNEQSAGRLDAVARGLTAQAEGLRQHVQRFQIG
jgi:methyl-accepting chemotaxis protein